MLIGSRALAHWIPEFKCRDNADWDWIGNLSSFGRVEVHGFDHLNNNKAVDLYSVYGIDGICSLKGLALIKRSHLWRDWQFDKHIATYHKWLKPHMVDLTRDDKEFLKERTKLTKEAYPQGNPNLNQSNDEFFDDAVDKKYDHDWLHELYAYGHRPMYEKLKRQERLDEAWCEKELWLELTYNERCKCVAEECYVIATERFLVPTEFEYFWKKAYMKALQKVCTTLCSGWFRDFAIDNYPEIIRLYDKEKIQKTRKILNV
mgnify:CR=1 FL=1